jgi:hypothetical protein
MQRTLKRHAPKTRPVSSYGFRRLPEFFKPATLSGSQVVAVETVPVPPLSSMGLVQFSDFERMESEGITYLNTYFVLEERESDESLHFHELVHVLQWRVLGPEKFLALYADGLERFGYRNSPLEVIAYSLQSNFDRGCSPFDVEAEVERQLKALRC